MTEIFTEKFEHSVRVTISKQGQEYYRKSIQELVEESESYDGMIEKRNQLLEADLCTDDYNFRLGGELENINRMEFMYQ